MRTLKLTRVGEHRMEGGLYKDAKGNYYVDCHNEIENSGVQVVYSLSPKKEADGEPDKRIRCNIVITNPLSDREVRMREFKFEYMMLDRLRIDFNYYENADHWNHAHVSTIEESIEYMKKIWNKIPEDLKPEWLTWDNILSFEKKFAK